MKRPSADRLALAFLTLAVIAVFFDVLFLGEGLVRGDLFRYHYPMKQVVRDTILSGEFPWWNRLYSGGQPMAANPAYEIFYPGQWPILLGSYRFGFNLHIVLHVWIALIGMYVLMREIPLGVAASMLGAASYGFSGFFFGILTTLPACFVWAWTPLLLAALLRFHRRRRRRDFILAAAVMAMQFLVAEPVSVLLNLMLVAAGALWVGGRPALRSTLMWLAIVVAAAAALAAVQIVPAFDHVRDTARVEGLRYDAVAQYSTPAGRLVELFLPFFYGHHADSGNYFWGAASFGRSSPYFASIYLGLLTSVLLVAAFFVFPRHGTAVAALCGIFYVVSLGTRTPLFAVLYDLGLTSWFRYPEKFLAATVVPIVLLAAAALDRFLAGEKKARAAVFGSAAATALAIAVLTAISKTDGYARWFARMWELPEGTRAAVYLQMSRDDLQQAALLAIALVILLAVIARKPAIALPALGLFAAVDLYRAGADVTVRMPERFFTPPGIVAAIPDARDGYAAFHLGDWLRETTAGSFRDIGNDFYWVARNGLMPPTAAAWGTRIALERDYDETYLRPTREMLDAFGHANRRTRVAWWPPLAAMANVRYVVDYRPMDEVARECGRNFEVSRPVSVRASRVDHARYFFADQTVRADGWRETVDLALSRPVVPRVAYVPRAPFVPSRARIASVKETPSRATIEVESEGEALLVMTVTRHRHWNVTLDGNEVPVLPVNIAFQGIIVPRGHHLVEMRYRNPYVVAGGVVSAAAVAGLALVAFGGLRWKKSAT